MLAVRKAYLGQGLQATYVWHNHAHAWKACFKDLYLLTDKVTWHLHAHGLSLWTDKYELHTCCNCHLVQDSDTRLLRQGYSGNTPAELQGQTHTGG